MTMTLFHSASRQQQQQQQQRRPFLSKVFLLWLFLLEGATIASAFALMPGHVFKTPFSVISTTLTSPSPATPQVPASKRHRSTTDLKYVQEPTEDTASSGDFFSKRSSKKGSSSSSSTKWLPQDAISNEDQVVASNSKSTNDFPKATFISRASENSNARAAVDELLQQQQPTLKNADLIFLFVGQYHASQFDDIVHYAQDKIMAMSSSSTETTTKNNAVQVQIQIQVVAVLGGGVIGGGNELDYTDSPCMSLLAGKLPPDSKATVFQHDKDHTLDDNDYHEGFPNKEIFLSQSSRLSETKKKDDRPPSFLILADPYAPLKELLTRLEQDANFNNSAPPVVAGGVTVPPPKQPDAPTLARNGHVLPAGSLIGVAFIGNVGLSAVVTQGARPVGPSFVVTEASNTVVTGLSGQSAISQLEQVARNANEQDQELIRNGEVVCGIGLIRTNINDRTLNDYTVDGATSLVAINYHGHDIGTKEQERMIRVDDDFLIRQIMGFRPQSGSIVVAAGGLKEGSTFRFHVRAAQSAREDMDLMIQRAKTERLFTGRRGKPLAAFQFSCVARGRSFYDESNVDLHKVQELFEDVNSAEENRSNISGASNNDDPSPIAGFFANGEIGPVGISMPEMAAKDAEQTETTSTTFLHGFTTVVAMLCDYSEASNSKESTEVTSDSIICSMDDAWA